MRQNGMQFVYKEHALIIYAFFKSKISFHVKLCFFQNCSFCGLQCTDTNHTVEQKAERTDQNPRNMSWCDLKCQLQRRKIG